MSAAHNQVRPSDYALLEQKIARATDLAWRLENQARSFYDALAEFVAFIREGQANGPYAWQERILPSTRTLPGWDSVEITWDAANETLHLLISLLGEIHKAAAELYADGPGGNGRRHLQPGTTRVRRLMEAESMVYAMIFEPSPQSVYWVEVNPGNGKLALNAAPVRVGPLIEKYLWHEKSSII